MNDLLYGLNRMRKNMQNATKHLTAQDDLGSKHRVQELSVWHTELARLLNNYYERQAKEEILARELERQSKKYLAEINDNCAPILPKTELGRKIIQGRQEYVRNGGIFKSLDEILEDLKED